MRKATSIEIPEDILDFIRIYFNEESTRRIRSGCYSYYRDLIRDIDRFINENKTRFPLYKSEFYSGVSADMIRRALNKKKPHGASREFRDLLSHYATDGNSNWNDLIKNHFPHHSNLVCDELKPVKNFPDHDSPFHSSDDEDYCFVCL